MTISRNDYDLAIVPNAFVVIAFTEKGPENIGQFATEAEARERAATVSHWSIAAQRQVDVASGARGGQDTAWTERNF